tara:strand:+ start:8163 stop:8387 length:225 start_codon:yes stop_codon:yes gene_type:complete
MLKFATIKINIKNKGSFKSFKPALSSKVAFLCNKQATGIVSNLDCDYTHFEKNILHSVIIVEDIPMMIEIHYKQ